MTSRAPRGDSICDMGASGSVRTPDAPKRRAASTVFLLRHGPRIDETEAVSRACHLQQMLLRVECVQHFAAATFVPAVAVAVVVPGAGRVETGSLPRQETSGSTHH
jgi:hypothetical protein